MLKEDKERVVAELTEKLRTADTLIVADYRAQRSEEHTSELQSHRDLHSFPTRRSSDLRTEAAQHAQKPSRGGLLGSSTSFESACARARFVKEEVECSRRTRNASSPS